MDTRLCALQRLPVGSVLPFLLRTISVDRVWIRPVRSGLIQDNPHCYGDVQAVLRLLILWCDYVAILTNALSQRRARVETEHPEQIVGYYEYHVSV